MFGLSLQTAKTVAIIVVVAFIMIGIVSALLIKAIVGKVVVVVIMAALAVAVYSQRTSLQDCANREKAAAASTTGTAKGDITCTFFGTKVNVPTLNS